MIQNEASRREHIEFIEQIHKELGRLDTHEASVIICGDLNVILDKAVDSSGGHPVEYTDSIHRLHALCESFDLIDSFRVRNDDKFLFTFAPMGRNPNGIFRRLDYIFVPNTWSDRISEDKAIPYSFTDHSLIQLSIRNNKQNSLNG